VLEARALHPMRTGLPYTQPCSIKYDDDVESREMRQSFVNLRSWLVEEIHLNLTQNRPFVEQQDSWMRAMIDDHPSDEDDYWRHVDYYVAQRDGLSDGYRAAADWVS